MFAHAAVGYLHLSLALWICILGCDDVAADARWQNFCDHLSYMATFLQRTASDEELTRANQLVRRVREQTPRLYPEVTLKLKGHYALHFADAVRRCVCACMFEQFVFVLYVSDVPLFHEVVSDFMFMFW